MSANWWSTRFAEGDRYLRANQVQWLTELSAAEIKELFALRQEALG